MDDRGEGRIMTRRGGGISCLDSGNVIFQTKFLAISR